MPAATRTVSCVAARNFVKFFTVNKTLTKTMTSDRTKSYIYIIKVTFHAVLWIRIRMFLGLLDPDPEGLIQRSESGFFCHQAKIGRKTMNPTVS